MWWALILGLAFQWFAPAERAAALSFLLDYRYDTNDFFEGNQPAMDALQAAADRYGAIVTKTLLSVDLEDGSSDHRVKFKHPGTGADFEVSAASNIGTDSLAIMSAFCPSCHPADSYRGPWSIAANQMVIFPGGRSLPGSTAGEASSGGGFNYSTVFTRSSSHLNRGFRPSYSTTNPHVPLWGGAIAFDNDSSTTWHFDHTTPAPANTTDFYSIALHEIGHILGLGTFWKEWDDNWAGVEFTGGNALDAYEADNGTSLNALLTEAANDPHFKNNTYDSYIFQNATPNLVGTVGTGVKQDLLMEPIANFTSTVRRFELTNVDVAALRDIGWTTVAQIDSQPGDYNKNGKVDAADFVVFRKGLADGNYATWRANYGESTPGNSPVNSPQLVGVPEPASLLIFLLAFGPLFIFKRPSRKC